MYKQFTRIISFDVGIRNLSYSLLSWDSRPASNSQTWTEDNVRGDGIQHVRVDEWKCIDILEAANKQSKNVYKCNTTMLVNCMIHVLHKEFFQLLKTQPDEVTAVIIEKQPGKSLRMDVLGYSIVAFIQTIAVEHNINVFIETMTAKNKLLLCDLLDVQVTVKTRASSAKVTKKQQKGQMYRLNKKKAIQGTKDIVDILQMRDELKSRFLTSKKKDDYADNLLQGIYFYLYGQRKCLFTFSLIDNKGKGKIKETKVFMTIDLRDKQDQSDEDQSLSDYGSVGISSSVDATDEDMIITEE